MIFCFCIPNPRLCRENCNEWWTTQKKKIHQNNRLNCFNHALHGNFLLVENFSMAFLWTVFLYERLESSTKINKRNGNYQYFFLIFRTFSVQDYWFFATALWRMQINDFIIEFVKGIIIILVWKCKSCIAAKIDKFLAVFRCVFGQMFLRYYWQKISQRRCASYLLSCGLQELCFQKVQFYVILFSYINKYWVLEN